MITGKDALRGVFRQSKLNIQEKIAMLVVKVWASIFASASDNKGFFTGSTKNHVLKSHLLQVLYCYYATRGDHLDGIIYQ